MHCSSNGQDADSCNKSERQAEVHALGIMTAYQLQQHPDDVTMFPAGLPNSSQAHASQGGPPSGWRMHAQQQRRCSRRGQQQPRQAARQRQGITKGEQQPPQPIGWGGRRGTVVGAFIWLRHRSYSHSSRSSSRHLSGYATSAAGPHQR
jgi:hypothetical protein